MSTSGNWMVPQVQFTERYIYRSRTSFCSVERSRSEWEKLLIYKGQIVMARRLRTRVSETACLVCCSRAAVVSTYQKGCTDGQMTNLRPAVCRQRGAETVAHCSQRIESPAATTVVTPPHANCTPSPTAHEMSRRSSRLDCGWLEEKVACSDDSRFLVHHVDGWAWIRRLPTEAMAPGCTLGQRRCYAVGDVFLGHFRPHYPNSTTPDGFQVSEHHCGPRAHIHSSCVPCQWWPLPAR